MNRCLPLQLQHRRFQQSIIVCGKPPCLPSTPTANRSKTHRKEKHKKNSLHTSQQTYYLNEIVCTLSVLLSIVNMDANNKETLEKILFRISID